jgi:galactosamine-6-phosphate isomerase
MQIERAGSYEEMSRRAARQIQRALRRKPDLLIGLATGATPTRTYELLAAAREAEPSRFRHLRVVKLDEWLGLPLGHPGSCESDLRRKVLGPLAVSRSRYRGFASRPRDPHAESRKLGRWLARHGPLDLCVLGLGTNGHLLMNEPGPALDPAPHVARLAPSTRRHSMLASTRVPPARGLTVGLGDILRAREVLLLISGSHKAAAFREMLARRVSTRCPASFLWLHPAATVHCDREAGRALGR